MEQKKRFVWQRIKADLTVLALLAIVVLPAQGLTVERPSAKEIPDAVREAVDKAVASVRPALVRIHVVAVEYDEGREVKRESTGSGVIITKDGHVVTNHHVVGEAKRIVCTLANKEEIEAELVGTDPLTDISVVKLRSEGRREFPVARFGDSSSLRAGDRVLAMGSPFALSQSVTMGVVSNTELVMPDLFWPFKFTVDGEDVGSIVRWIGHDASIHSGSSGGPLVNLQGQVVGINEIRLGLSAAIPANLARNVAEQLIKHGKVTRSWIGLEVQPLLRASGRERGVLVSGTIEGSPAEKAGFLPGDILIRFAGKDVNVRFPEELPVFNQLLVGLPVGEEVEAVVFRKDKEKTLRVTTQEREDVRAKTQELKRWGICARNLSLLAAKELRRSSRDGVLVTSVRPGGPCGEAKPRIIKNDVIMDVEGMAVKNVKALLKVTDKVVQGKSEPVPVMVAFERKMECYLTVVKVGIQKLEDPGVEVRKAWLPVRTQVLTRDIAEALGIRDYTGVRVAHVYSSNSTAEKAGFKVGDFIVGLDGEPIPASEPEDIEVFPAMIRQYRIGSEVELTLLRDKKERKVRVGLLESPKLAREMPKYRDENFEFTVRDIAFLDRARENWKEEQGGALVEEVGEGGWAAIGHLAVGDLILQVDGQPVLDVLSLEKIMETIAAEKPQRVVLQVQRGIHNLYIELEPGWPGSD